MRMLRRTLMVKTYGKVVMALASAPRYRHLALGDLASVVLDPLVRDRISTAQPMKEGAPIEGDMLGIAIWASVSDEVDAKIREQISHGVFPIRLKSEDWTSGAINWLLDLIAPNPQLASLVLGNFRHVVKQDQLNVHPIVGKLVDRKVLKEMGVSSAVMPEVAAPFN
jgi:cytolysin-activating lysine-acyltransferase